MTGRITQLENALSTKTYPVRFGNKSKYPSCQCLEWQKHRLPCKHFCAIFQHTQWKWESLSLLYTNNPLFCLHDFCFGSIGSLNDHKLPENKKTQCNNKNENCKVIDCADGKCEVTDISYHSHMLQTMAIHKLNYINIVVKGLLNYLQGMFSGQHSIKRNAGRS